MSSALADRLLAALPAAAGADAAAARAAFAAAGLPDRKVEAWRYSTLGGMESLDPTAGFVDSLGLPELSGIAGTLVECAGGQYVLADTLPDGVTVVSAAAAPVGAGSARELVATETENDRGQSPLLQSAAPHGLQSRTARAQAFRWLAHAGAAEELQVDVTAPVSGIWRLAWQHDTAGLAQSRCRVRVRSGASISLVEHHFGSDVAAGLANRLLAIEVEDGASLTWIRVQETGAKAQSVQHSDVRVAAGGRFALVALELGGLWSRHTLALDLAVAGSEARVAGLVALQGRQHHDTQLSLAHTAGGASSRTLWKAIANQRARSVFNGLITVAPGADQTEAHLKTSNLLLSPHAEIDTKPELVIEADEVVCSHGATVGQLDDRALFYLRSRGIPEAQARQMLTLAFGGEVLSAIDSPDLRAALAERVSTHLPQSA